MEQRQKLNSENKDLKNSEAILGEAKRNLEAKMNNMSIEQKKRQEELLKIKQQLEKQEAIHKEQVKFIQKSQKKDTKLIQQNHAEEIQGIHKSYEQRMKDMEELIEELRRQSYQPQEPEFQLSTKEENKSSLQEEHKGPLKKSKNNAKVKPKKK